MSLLDMRTVIFGYVISNGICALVIAVLWRQNRSRFAGLEFWLTNFIVQFFALLLVALRGSVPDFLSMTVSNGLIVAGIVSLYIGLEAFLGKRGPQIHNFILLLFFLFAHAFFGFVRPSLQIRNILLSLGLLLTCFQCAWLMLYRADRDIRPFARGVGIAFVGYCLVSIIRIGVDLALAPDNDLFRSNIYDTALVMIYQMLAIIITFDLFLMVNRRLFADLDKDTAIRKKMEEALRLSEERFSKAFHHSPDAIIISRLSDGQLIEVNEGFYRLSGYSREEALSISSVTLGLWANPQDRKRFAADLIKHHSIRDREYEFCTKSGNVLNCLYSGEIFDLGGEPHALSVVRDISEEKQVDKIIRLRLRIIEYAETHTIGELMQKALDEICVLTNSPIGFYHFVEEDQNTLTLQAWSTRTLKEFCRAEGRGLHYSIDEAGVWVDCVRQRKPVIHNNYAALPNRKGLPEGHAEVIRELVVPIMREGRVVSILGVGNKPFGYDEKDSEIVSYIADIVWAIFDRKQADDRIRQLNSRLEHLAMTDELTGLSNRRSFFGRGEKEFGLAQRYRVPFSLLMLDIDGFKRINDTFGHDAGDQMLKCVADTLNQNIRDIDLLARLGGEEFGVLLANTKVEDAGFLAERLRLLIENLVCPIQGHEIGVTVSIGVSAVNEGMKDFDNVLKNADKAMYKAKKQGKNRVAIMG